MPESKRENLKDIFHVASQLPLAERVPYLEQICAGNPSLREKLESLLNSHDETTNFLDQPGYQPAAQMLIHDDQLKPNQMVAHYSICALLGSGGMGSVYLAKDTKLNRNVALKVLSSSGATDNTARARLLREARAAAALDHPNICAIHEVADASGTSYIAMQFIEGESLAEVLQRRQLTPVEVLTIASQIAEGLAEAHRHNIVHRDIKPQNIMLTPQGRVKILDFGIAKVVIDHLTANHETETETILTKAGVIIGTVPYMSPEQVRGESVDARSDMFSFGTVVYEMFTRHQPFAKNTTAEVISAILTADPPPFANFSVRVPKELEATVRKCLEKDRSDRYTTMTEVATHVEHLRNGHEKGELITSFLNNPASSGVLQGANTLSRVRSFLTTHLILTVGAIILVLALGSIIAVFVRNRSEAKSEGTSVNSGAYDYYLRGRVNAGSENRENIEDAIKLLEQAVASDPKLAPAHAELAKAYITKATYFVSDSERKELSVNAEVEVEKALILNPDLPEGHLARSVVMWTSDKGFPHELAIQSLKKALELNPNLGEAHNRLGVIYFHIGLLDKAWAEITKALEINPANTNARFRLGVIKIYQGKYEDALELLKSIPHEANPALVDRNIATALFQLGRIDEASTIVENYLHVYPTDEGGNMTSVKAMLLAKAGKEREAEEAINRAEQIGKGFVHFHHTAYNIGSAYALLNKPEESVKWLQVAIDDGFPCFPVFEIDANLNNLRKDQRFISMIAQLKQRWEKYNRTL